MTNTNTAWAFALLGVFAFGGCVSFSEATLYAEAAAPVTEASVGNVYSVNIFNDALSSENWYSEFPQCLQVKNGKEFGKDGSGGLYFKWNRQGDGCDWTGMGFGWDGWASKDLSTILNESAISFYAKSPAGAIKSLPWAVALEDYSGAQAYAGVFPACIQGGVISDTGWTQVIVPMNSFDLRENGFDATIVKQFMIQFEAAGEVMIDEIRIIDYDKARKKSFNFVASRPQTLPIKEVGPIMSDGPIEVGDHRITLSYDEEKLFINAVVVDESPLINPHDDADIWNGDCIELAFATNPEADPSRRFLLMSDRHIGIRAGGEPLVYDWRTKSSISGSTVTTETTANGYVLRATIPWEGLRAAPPMADAAYGFECAVDIGSAEGVRIRQDRWNSMFSDGFHQNPSLWGSFILPTHP